MNQHSGDDPYQDHRARRRFGQNFLIDPDIIRRIIASVPVRQHSTVVEIGPGRGALTSGLLAAVERINGRLILIELDRDLGAVLEQQYAHHPLVRVIVADALSVDLRSFNAEQSLHVVGNLPYNISTPLLFHFFEHAESITDMTFMLQREVALRMLAGAGDRNYGRLSVMTQFYCSGELVLKVPPGAFRPAPKVHSSVIQLKPKPLLLTEKDEQKAFAQVVRTAFGQRRKTLRNSLRQLLPAQAISACGIDPGCRPETLTIENFVSLSRLIQQ